MDIWKLQRTKEALWHEETAMVIVAVTERDARRIASEAHGDKWGVWLSPDLTQCQCIGVAYDHVPDGVLLREVKTAG